jgi:UDP-N-acetylglucosamine 1-carboxyvinyltransferase
VILIEQLLWDTIFNHLKATTMSSPDIRAGISLLIAALSAKGTSTIQNIEQIDRGYEKLTSD